MNENEVFNAASDERGVDRALMVNPDHPETVAALLAAAGRGHSGASS